jgi:Na+-driven multidrug efflux pump/anti-sigma regulatory factor (Ser/Thr protein kinase)
LLGAKGEQAILTREYAGMIFFMSPFLILNITLAFLVRSDGRPKLAMSGMLISVVANIVSNVIFVGPLNMGLTGAGLATGVASAVSAVILSTHFFSKKNTLKLTKPVISRIPTVFKNGIGTSMTFVYMFITILFFNNLIVRVSGGDGIIVYTVIMNVANIAMSIFEGLSQTVQPMFSVYHGEKNNSAMKATFKLVVKMTVILGGVVTVLLQLFPNLLVRAFGVTGEFAGASVFGIRVFSICIILMTFNVVMGYYYQSTGRPMLATMIVFIRNLAAQNIGALIFGIIWGLNGIWFSYLFSELVTLFIWCVYVKAVAQKLQLEGGILLLQPQVNVYNREIECNLEKLPEILQESESFMLSHNIEKKRAGRIRLAIEELVSNVINHGGEKLKHIEIRIVLQDEISLIVRDDGVLFDHSTFIYSGRADIPGGQGLELVRKTALSFEYRPVLGMNRTLLTY